MKKLFLTTTLLFAFIGLAHAELPAPTLLKPDNAANLPLKKVAKFTWEKVTGAKKYRLIFSNDKSFANYDANNSKCLDKTTCFIYTTTSTSYKVSASSAMLKTDGNYFWQVQAVNSKEQSQITTSTTELGEVRSFFVRTYTKIANDGSLLPNDAKLGLNSTDWACTKDSKTGLIWEVKTDDGSFRDRKLQNNTWYEPDSSKNNGNPGSQDGNSNTKIYTDAVNAIGLCGKNDWRMPTKNELLGIVKLGEIPAIDTVYFPDTIDENRMFWSSTLYKSGGGNAWYVNFEDGTSSNQGKSGRHFNVRLVRSDIKAITPTPVIKLTHREKCLKDLKDNAYAYAYAGKTTSQYFYCSLLKD